MAAAENFDPKVFTDVLIADVQDEYASMNSLLISHSAPSLRTCSENLESAMTMFSIDDKHINADLESLAALLIGRQAT